VIGLPIEDNGGSGTVDVHPEEGLENEVSSDTRYINGIFHPGINEELMTGWMEGSPTDTPISRVTLGFLEDMGYIVNYSDAESFSIIYTSMSFSDYRKQNKTISEMKSLGYTDTQILQDGYYNIIDLSLAGYTANQIMTAKISAGNFDMSWNNIVSSDLSYQFMSGGQPGLLYYSPAGRLCYANGLNYQLDNVNDGTSSRHYKNGEFAPTSFSSFETDTNTTMEPLTPGAHFVIDPSGNLNIGIHGQSFAAGTGVDTHADYTYEAWCNTIDASTGLYMHYKGGRFSVYQQFDRTTGVIYHERPMGERISNDYLAGNTSTEITKYNRIMFNAGSSGALGNGVLQDIGYGSSRGSAKHPVQDWGRRNSLRQFITGGKQWVIDNSHNSYFCSDNTSGQYGQSLGSHTFSSFGGPQISMLWQADPDHNSGLNMGPYHYNRLARQKYFQIEIENGKFTVNGVSQDTIRADVGHIMHICYYDFHETGYTFSISSTNDGTHNSGTELSDGWGAFSTRTDQQNNAYINNDFNIYERDFTPTTAGTYYYYCPEAAGYGGTIIIDASGASQEGYQNYDNSTGLHALFRGDYTDTNGKGAVTTPSGMIVRKHGNDGHVLWYTSWNNAAGSSAQNHIQINDVTRAGYKSNIRNPVSNWTLDIDITTTFTEISNHYGVYLYDSFFDSSDNLILGGSVRTTTSTNGQNTYYSLLMRVAVDDVSGSLRAYKLQQIPNLIEEDSVSNHKHGWSTGVRTMFDNNHNYLVATPYNVDASYGVSVYKFDSSFNLDTTYGVDGSFNSIYTPYYKQNTNTGNNFMFGSRTETSYSDDNNSQILGATAYDSTDDSLYIIGAGDNPSTSSADHNFVSIIKLDNTGNYDASFSSIYGAAGQLDIVDVIEKKTGASGTTHDGYTTYFGSSARNSILCPTAAIIRENALFIACSGHTAPYNGIYILKLKLSNAADVRDLSNINFTLSDFQSSGYTNMSELRKIPYPLTDYKTVGFSASNMLSGFSVQETLSAGYSSQEILDSQMESFLQEDFATFDAANKFKETYMKTFLDVSGDIRLDSNYTAIFNAFGDASANEIKNILRTNTLDASYIIHDLSVNQHLFVQNDISLNKKMFIAGDLSVNGTLQFPDNSLSESDFTDAFVSTIGSNQFNNNNSQIIGALDISGLEFYVAGDVTAVDKDFQVEGNTYANNFINDELDNVIMEDDSLINRLDLSNNAFSISKIYYDTSYSNIASDFSYNAVPFISDNGKNICYPTYDIDGTTNYYNTLYSNNHGTSFIDMATRLGGTAGSTNTKGLLNFYVTENQKYIYGYHNSEGIKRSDNYGYSFTDISMVKVPNSDLSYCVGLSSTNSAFDTTHSNLIASSASGKHIYLGGFKPYDTDGPNTDDIGHFLIKSSDFGQTMNFDLSASAINMVTHQNSDLSFNSMIGSRHVSCSADGKYVICSVHGFTPLDDLNIVSATTSSANWYPVLSRNYGTNWDLLTSETFKDYHLLENTDASFNTSNSLNNCVGTAVSKTGKYVACAFNSATSIPKPIMFYLSSDYGKTFHLKANLEVDDATYISNGLQLSVSSNAETISLLSTKSASKVYYSSDYGTTWNTKSIALSNDKKEHYSQISSNSQFLIRNITSESISNNVTANSTITFDSSLSAIGMLSTSYTGTTNTPYWFPQSNANVISNDDGDIILLGAPKSSNNHSAYKGTGLASVFKYQTVTQTEYNNAVKDLVRKYDGTDPSRSDNRVLFTSGNSWSADQKFWYQQGGPFTSSNYFYRSFLGQGSMGMSSDGLTVGIGMISWWGYIFHGGNVRCWEYRTVTEDEWNNGFPIQWTSIAAQWQYEDGREFTTLGYGQQGAYNTTAYPTIITDEAGAVSTSALGGASNITEQHDPNKKYWVQKGINDVCAASRYGSLTGSAVSLSSDGNTIAVGEPDNNDGKTNETGYNTTNALSSQFSNNNGYKGSIRVFHYNSTTTRWEQMGSSFIGSNDGDHIGDIDAMKLSKDGSVLIYLEKDATNGKGIVKAWKWSNPGSSTGSWSQMGSDITVGDNQYDFYGGLPSRNHANLSNLTGITSATAAGATNWYGRPVSTGQEHHYPNSGGNERGQFVNLAGVDINDDASIVAIGSFFVNDHKGAVKVYEYSTPGATGGSWSQKGSTLTGRGDSEEMFSKPSLNGDGTVLLVGAHFRTASYARIHKFTNNDWVQIGSDIQGETSTDTTGTRWGFDVAHFGGYVRLNKDGTKAFISDSKSNNDAENVTGLTQVYNLSSETQSSYYNSKLCKQITPYVKTYYTHMVKDFSNISNGNSSADSSITYSGGILTASDYRLKSNVQQLQDETVDNLQPVKFTFKNSQQETFGLIAHELEENYPFLVDGEKDGSHYQTVNYNGLLGVLVHELQLIRKGLEEYE
jgi:hypothetical protein